MKNENESSINSIWRNGKNGKESENMQSENIEMKAMAKSKMKYQQRKENDENINEMKSK
jgi:hypothetical protein